MWLCGLFTVSFAWEWGEKLLGSKKKLLCHSESMCGLQVFQIVLHAQSSHHKNKSLHSIKRITMVHEK
jgi:hypothetical protein